MFHDGRPPHLLPMSAFRFTPTLCITNFYFCHFPAIDAGPVLIFPQLKHLYLDNTVILDAAIHRLIAGCTALEGLEINAIRGLRSTHIISPTIRTFVVFGWWSPFGTSQVLRELIIQDAHCLERLIILHSSSIETIILVEAPKLRILCHTIHNNTQLLIGAITF
jgi:hypothetical protein